MKITKANIIRLLQVKADNEYTVYRMLKDEPKQTPESKRTAEKALTYHSAYYEVLNLMTDKKYFDEIAKIYFPGEE